jgi:tetratricopeptide (TPR) repeat protein
MSFWVWPAAALLLLAGCGGPAPAPSPGHAPASGSVEKAAVRLSGDTLRWQGADGVSPYLQALKPAMDAYADGEYALARERFDALGRKYPAAIEVRFYQGVTLLLLGDFAAAITPLEAAAALGDPQFGADVARYLALARQRAANDR